MRDSHIYEIISSYIIFNIHYINLNILNNLKICRNPNATSLRYKGIKDIFFFRKYFVIYNFVIYICFFVRFSSLIFDLQSYDNVSS